MAYRYQGDAALVAQDAGTCALQMGFESVFWRALIPRESATQRLGISPQPRPSHPARGGAFLDCKGSLGDIWRGQAPSEERTCPLRQLQAFSDM
jgi:hypothetical protein